MIHSNIVRFEAFTAVTMKNVVFWDVALCSSLCESTFLRNVTPRSLQPPAHAGSPLADFSTLKMEAIRSSETKVDARSTQRHIPENDILHSNILRNLYMLSTHCYIPK
jgi:hypothetical protein